jgi:hypothetical protein
MKWPIIAALIPLLMAISTQAKSDVRFLCKGHTPISIRLHLTVMNPYRATMTIDSEDLYPHTGGSWRLLLERNSDQPQEPKQSVTLKTYDDAFLYRLLIPRAVANGVSPKKFQSELLWQTDEQASVYSEELLCYLGE